MRNRERLGLMPASLEPLHERTAAGPGVLPLLVSVPHAGLAVPPEAEPYRILTDAQIADDADGQAREVYARLDGRVRAFLSSDVARAIVDLNRASGDFGPDGVVKTATCSEDPVYNPFPPESVVDTLLQRYYRPYHEHLSRLAAMEGVVLGVDCHTMAATGPSAGPDPGRKRPLACLSDAGGTLPGPWFTRLARCFTAQFGPSVSLNDPFKGGWITSSHASELPWVQIELSRSEELSPEDKSNRVLAALTDFCDGLPIESSTRGVET